MHGIHCNNQHKCHMPAVVLGVPAHHLHASVNLQIPLGRTTQARIYPQRGYAQSSHALLERRVHNPAGCDKLYRPAGSCCHVASGQQLVMML
jgi:hypothetical protein